MALNLTKRRDKGSALTHDEMDDNWEDIEAEVAGQEQRLDAAIDEDGNIRDPKVVYAATAVGTDAYSVVIDGEFNAITDFAGVEIQILIDVANTGSATLEINDFAPVAIKKFGTQDLSSGDLKPGVAKFVYDATNAVFNLVNPASNSKQNYADGAGSANAQSVTITSLNNSTFEVPAAYYAGYTVHFKASVTNTGATTFAVNATTPSIALGAVAVKKNGTSDLTGGEITAGQIYTLVHDGTYWQLGTGGFNPVVLQVVTAELVTSGSNAATIPEDTTIPQNTEGTEILTCSITPKSASSKLYVEAITHLGNGAVTRSIAALFRDSTADAIAAGKIKVDGPDTAYSLTVKKVVDSTATTLTTFKLRVGGASGTVYWNRDSTGSTLGGVFTTTITITEVLT